MQRNCTQLQPPYVDRQNLGQLLDALDAMFNQVHCHRHTTEEKKGGGGGGDSAAGITNAIDHVVPNKHISQPTDKPIIVPGSMSRESR